MNQFFKIFLCGFISVSASAAQKSKTEVVSIPADEVQNFSVPVQQSTVDLKDSKYEYQPSSADFEIMTSTWMPRSFSRPSLIDSDPNFKSGNVPFIGLNRVNSFHSISNGIYESELGFSYAQLLRNGIVTSGINTLSTTEKLNVASIKVGVNYRYIVKNFRYLQPSVGVAVLPTWLSSEKSAFEVYGVNATGLMYSANLKLMYCPDFMQNTSTDQSGEGLGIAYIITTGTIGGSDLAGSGLQLILRMKM